MGGAPGRIRTHDPLVRSQVLYPTELRARRGTHNTMSRGRPPGQADCRRPEHPHQDGRGAPRQHHGQIRGPHHGRPDAALPGQQPGLIRRPDPTGRQTDRQRSAPAGSGHFCPDTHALFPGELRASSLRAKKKGLNSFRIQALEWVARPAGFEPTTPWFVAKYSIQLSYGRDAERIIT